MYLMLNRSPPTRPRSGGTQVRTAPGTQPSKHRKLERRKGAEEESRKGRIRKEAKHNMLRPEDFGGRARQRAMRKSPIVERRASVS